MAAGVRSPRRAMAGPRERTDVDEYIDALRTWIHLTDYFGELGKGIVDQACGDLAARHRGTVAIEVLCGAMTTWAARHPSLLVDKIGLMIEKSCLLDRLIYAGE